MFLPPEHEPEQHSEPELQVAPVSFRVQAVGAGVTGDGVGDEVRAQFLAQDSNAELAFKRHGDKWLCNMYLIARQRLTALGVTEIYGASVNEDFCTYSDEARFFSFRRDNVTGRMASMIWLEPNLG